MSKPEKKGLVPELRFPEFRDAEGWAQAKIEAIAISESSTLALNKLSFRPEGNPVYGADSCVGFIDSFAQDEDYIAIVKDGSGVGRLSLKRGKSSVLSTLAYLKCKPNSGTMLLWLYYCLNSLDFRKYVKGSGIPHIYFSDYATHDILVPSPQEQKKIADCLTSVDELIAAQTKKLDALKTHKKGLMQKLFPAEGETVPKLRFPEFATAWNKTKIGKVVDLLSGYAFKSEYFAEKGTKLLTPKNFTKDGYASFKKDNTKYTTEVVDEKYACREGDLLLLLTDLTPSCELLGRPLLLTKHDGIVLLNQRIVKVIPKDAVEIRFLQYFFITEAYSKRIRETAAGSTVRHSSNKIISTTDIYLPTRFEQQKITDCLIAIDDLIIAQTQKLEALKTHKKGLMQQLFPAPELSNL